MIGAMASVTTGVTISAESNVTANATTCAGTVITMDVIAKNLAAMTHLLGMNLSKQMT
jgi:bifunctional N-acetylglucosamine-1-phosphate-uridyltransferase/glucosamine-1-phosphate-acetyltransferase GlmU-like protein